ncbi:hypothetical protein ONZ45_g9691 [Pleurotus djamor]|nr:hypothetical protein ONZ45_g9691 [Pleurotus djamor]
MDRKLAERENNLKGESFLDYTLHSRLNPPPELIGRARATPNRTAALRRNTLKQLIELTQDPQPSLKILAAEGIPSFFKDFPELEEASINSVYDLCEDQSSKVRIEGYKTLAELSKAEPKWVKRNADVLIQLLQSDEPDEVTVVKQALVDHLNLDAPITFGVLCDQLSPSEDIIDEEEKGLRERLRGLVLSFIAVDAKTCIKQHIPPGSPTEDILHRGLLAAIPTLNQADIRTVVQDILILLPSYSSSQTSRGQALVQALLSRASESLRSALRAPGKAVSLEDTWFFVDLAHFVAVENNFAPAIDLVVFYLSSLTSKMTLQRLAKQDQDSVIIHVANSIAASRHVNHDLVDEQQVMKVRRQAVDGLPILFERLLENNNTGDPIKKACIVLLTECQRRKVNDAWAVPPHFIAIFGRMQNSPLSTQEGNTSSHIRNLLKSLAPSNVTLRRDDPTTPKPPTTPTPTQTSSRLPTTSIRHGSSINFGTSSSAKLITDPQASDSEPRSSKRLKHTEEPDVGPGFPTLLSRMGKASLNSNSTAPQRRNPLPAAANLPPKPQVRLSSFSEVQGLSIKGAASRGSGSVAAVKMASPGTPSLLNRLQNRHASAHNNGGASTDLGLRLGKRKELP